MVSKVRPYGEQISFLSKIRISDFVRTIKSITRRLLKKRFEYMRPSKIRSQSILRNRRHMVRWLSGHGSSPVSTIGIDEVIIKRYIEKQYKEEEFFNLRSCSVEFS